MSKNFVQSAVLRSTLLGSYRLYARANFWRKGPRIFINSIPKSGTHLLAAELEKFPDLQNSRLWIEWRTINALATKDEFREDFSLDVNRFNSYVSQVRNGQYFTGHFWYHREIHNILNSNGVKTIFVSRHPLDVISSILHYVKGLKRHVVHDFFMNELQNDEQRLQAILHGHPATPYMPAFKTTLRNYYGWMEQSDVLAVKFEDLVGVRGGGDDGVRNERLRQVADFCGVVAPPPTDTTTTTPRSATFRKGRSFAWKDTLSEEFVAEVIDVCGQEIARYGYAV